ncbi:protein kinase domain-containing protein [Marinomonas mediterranea]|uniref:Serine/threonine protein kinase n=1 Tax=Marinomonas mediterranea (strain ATCC 700492 / JCM 21426 / NBRC 103028 / MMB-1) TaxID=717774 RepID=F2JU59_MARM1|nr:protein kinase [Marinomonas mediterranea]ADZ91571.1 serine/threonine protein kinase [Marinomonas mediterranea MMB-1]WCN17675.1 protein kinase [Marinomonas mediterranea MMB-1]
MRQIENNLTTEVNQRFTNISTRFISNAYELLHKIGEGGFGVVYKAVYKRTGQPVAIKFLHISQEKDTGQQARQLARFERESNIVSQLSHAHIVRLLDKGVMDDTTVFSVFEFVEGTSLSDHIKQHGALSINETYDIMLQVLDAIVYAHSQGIIHRDVKPSNIMLNHSGAKLHAKLLDFGISTLTLGQQPEDYRAITITQESLGTPTYCSPEQLRGELTTFSTDLYMWGLVFIECLTGAPAVPGTSVAEIYHQHLNDVPIKIPAPLLDHPLGALLEKTLRKNPKDRIDDAQVLFDDLSSLLVNNLVGKLLPDSSNATSLNSLENTGANNTATLLLRTDDPNFIPSVATQSIERRYMTVLSLTINVLHTDRYDAAEADVVEALFQSTQNQYIDVARRYGGFHVGNLSNQSVFYFGYPVGSDHDARLAARTALEILSLSKRQASYLTKKHGCTFETNCGIHSGIMLKRSNQVPEGFTSHTATQMAQAASNRQILCSADTQAILSPYYNFTENRHAEKNNTAQRHAELTSERVIEAFGFIRGTRNAYPLVGRQTELNQIRASITRPEQYAPEDKALHNTTNTRDTNQAVYIHGDAGVGKSRLIQELRRHESTRSQKIFQCLPEHQNNALYPVLTVIKRHLTQHTLEDSSEYRHLVDTLVDAEFTGSKDEITTLLAIWLNLPDIDNKSLSSLSPAAQKELLFEGLAYLLHENTTLHPLYIFEDIHWADNTTLEFIAALQSTAQQTKQQQSEQTVTQIEQGLGSDNLNSDDLKSASEYDDESKAQHKSESNNENKAEHNDQPSIVITSRNELPAQLNDSSIYPIALAPLDQAATEAFISELFGGADISDAVKNVLLERTDGIPLFIEELATAMRRNNTVRIQNNTVDFTDPDNIDQIPSSLRESIQSKIDHLVYAKDTLQLASSFGRQFSYNLLVAASPYSELQVQNDLDELINNQVIIQQRHVDGDRYLFKHALVRDAGYDSIDTQARPAIHGLIADAIQEHADISDRFVATELAQHYEKAGVPEQACQWYNQAATAAKDTFAIDDAIHLYEAALTNVRRAQINQPLLNAVATDDQHESHNSNTSEALTLKLKDILDGLAACLSRDGQHENARTYLEELNSLLEIDKQYEWLASSLVALGKTYEVIHQHNDALKYYEQALAVLEKAPHSEEPDKSNWWQVWLEIKSAKVYVYYWLVDTEKMHVILIDLEDKLFRLGNHLKLAHFYLNKLQFLYRIKSYAPCDDYIAPSKNAIKYAKSSHCKITLATTVFGLGFSLILCKEYKEAVKNLEIALKQAESNCDKTLTIRCLVYLSIAYRLTGNIHSCRVNAEKAVLVLKSSPMEEYRAVSLANISWCYFRQKKYSDSCHNIKESLIIWNEIGEKIAFPFLWTSHLHAIVLKKYYGDIVYPNQLTELDLAKEILKEKQSKLPEEIVKTLREIITFGEIGLSEIDKIENVTSKHKLI